MCITLGTTKYNSLMYLRGFYAFSSDIKKIIQRGNALSDNFCFSQLPGTIFAQRSAVLS